MCKKSTVDFIKSRWINLNPLIRFLILFFLIPTGITFLIFVNLYKEDIPLRSGKIIPAPIPSFLARLFQVTLDYQSLEICINNRNLIPKDINKKPDDGAVAIKIFLNNQKIDEVYAEIGERKCKPLYAGTGVVFVAEINELYYDYDYNLEKTVVDITQTESYIKQKMDITSIILNFASVFIGWSAFCLYMKKLYNFVCSRFDEQC